MAIADVLPAFALTAKGFLGRQCLGSSAKIVWLKCLALATYILVLFFLLRMRHLILRFHDSQTLSNLQVTSLPVPVLKELLEARGTYRTEALEKRELFDLVKRSGVTETEVATVLEQEAAASVAAADGMDTPFLTTYALSSRVAWLVEVVVGQKSDSLRSSSDYPVTNKTWRDIKHKLAMLAVSTATLDCRTNQKWCKERKLSSPTFQLYLPGNDNGNPEMVSYTGLMTQQRVYGWVLENLQKTVRRIRKDGPDLQNAWLTVNDPTQQPELHLILFTVRQPPPSFCSALSVLFLGTVRFGWMQTQTGQELLDRTSGTALHESLLARLENSPGRSDHSPVIVIASHESVYLYGEREEECFSFLCLRDFLSHYRPGQDSLCSLTILISIAVGALDVYVCKTSSVKSVMKSVGVDFFVTVCVWLLVSHAQDLAVFQPFFVLVLKVCRSLAMTSFGAFLRHEVIALWRHWMYILPLSLGVTHILLTTIMQRLVGEVLVEEVLDVAEEQLAAEPREDHHPIQLSPEAIERLQQFMAQLILEEINQPAVNGVSVLPEWTYSPGRGPPEGYRQEADDNHCPVCYQVYSEGDRMTGLPCRHVFHRDCLISWLNIAHYQTCPICQL